MRTVVIGLLLAASAGVYGHGQQKQAGGPIINRRMIMEDQVIAFYVKQFPKQAGISDETLGKILPSLRDFLQARFDISNRRTQALNRLRQMSQNGNAADEDFKRAVQDFDMADSALQANQEKFLSNVDPLLTPKQQARLRLFQVQADNQMRRMLDQLQQAQQAARQNSSANPQD